MVDASSLEPDLVSGLDILITESLLVVFILVNQEVLKIKVTGNRVGINNPIAMMKLEELHV